MFCFGFNLADKAVTAITDRDVFYRKSSFDAYERHFMLAKKIIIEENHLKNMQVSSVCNYVINDRLSNVKWDKHLAAKLFAGQGQSCALLITSVVLLEAAVEGPCLAC